MDYYLNQLTNQFTRSIGFPGSVTTATFKARDTITLDVYFHNGSNLLALAEGASLVFIIKASFEQNAVALALADEWDEIASGHYRSQLNLNTEALIAAMGDLDLLNLFAELTWSETPGHWESSPTLRVRLNNDLYKGIEGTPLELPTPLSWLAANLNPALTAYANAEDAAARRALDGSAKKPVQTSTFPLNGVATFGSGDTEFTVTRTDSIPHNLSIIVYAQTSGAFDLFASYNGGFGESGLDAGVIVLLETNEAGEILSTVSEVVAAINNIEFESGNMALTAATTDGSGLAFEAGELFIANTSPATELGQTVVYTPESGPTRLFKLGSLAPVTHIEINKAITQAEIQAAITDDKSFRDRIGTALTKVTGNNLLPEFLGAIANLRETGVGRATILNAGDSTGADIMAYLYQNMWSAYGFGGYTGKNIANFIENNMANGATISADNIDFTKWPSSKHYTLPSAGTVTWTRAGGYTGNLRFVASVLKVYYITASGAGTFKVQYQNSASTWTDIAGYTAVSAVGSDGLGILTIPVPDGVREYVWRVLGVSGTVTICDLGVLNTAGFNHVAWNCGGTDIANAMGTKAGVARTPANIVTAALADIVPDLLIHATKDDIGPLTGALPVWQAFLNTANPLMDCIFCGNYSDSSGDTNRRAANLAIKTHAVSAGKTYYDYFLTAAEMTNYNFALDVTHANPRFQRWLGLQFCEDFGLLRGPNGQIPFPVNNMSVRTQSVEASVAVRSSLAEISRIAVGGYGATARTSITGSAVTSATVTGRGRGYFNPVAAFTGGAGSGATATVQVANGEVTGVTITAGGTGYNSPPTITINEGSSSSWTFNSVTGITAAILVGNQTINCASGVALRLVGTGTNVTNLRIVSAATNPTPITIFDNDDVTQRLAISRSGITNFVGDFRIENSAGNILFISSGTERFRCNAAGLQMADGANVVLGTTNGTRLGTNANQRLGFWNATPVVQPAAIPNTTGAVLTAIEDEVNKLKVMLRSIGIIAP